MATTDAMLQSNLKGLSPQIVPVMPLDRDILQALLSYAYPESPIDDKVMAGLPLDAVVSRLDAESLTLALRAKDPVTALQNIATFITPVKSDGLGLADFPLPAEVRGPVEQLVADMRAWQAGEIPWRDVSRGLLLVGPPGSGKTEIPRLIAKEAGITVVAGSVAQWSSEGSRGSEVIKAMRNSFAKAAAQAPAVLFLDEIDAFGDRLRAQDHNSAWTDHIVTALLDALDGYHGHEGVVVIAATNHLGKVDAAVRRPGRFDRTVTLGYPDHDLMPAAIRWQLAGDLPDADLSVVAVAAVGMSGAEVAALVRAARALARKDRRALTVEDLSAAVAAIRPPLSEQLHWRVAVHEAGHAIVGTATGLARPTSIAIVSTGGFATQALQKGAGSREDFEAMLKISLAGRAAEMLVLGAHSMGAGGAEGSDLAHATGLSAAMEMSYGLGASTVWLGPPETAAARVRIDSALRMRVEAHLRQAEVEAMQILNANLDLLEEMATALAKHKFLSGPALDALAARVVQPDPAKVEARREGFHADPNAAPDVEGGTESFSEEAVAKEPDGPV